MHEPEESLNTTIETSPSQAWIVDNIRSLILNDCSSSSLPSSLNATPNDDSRSTKNFKNRKENKEDLSNLSISSSSSLNATSDFNSTLIRVDDENDNDGVYYSDSESDSKIKNKLRKTPIKKMEDVEKSRTLNENQNTMNSKIFSPEEIQSRNFYSYHQQLQRLQQQQQQLQQQLQIQQNLAKRFPSSDISSTMLNQLNFNYAQLAASLNEASLLNHHEGELKSYMNDFSLFEEFNSAGDAAGPPGLTIGSNFEACGGDGDATNHYYFEYDHEDESGYNNSNMSSLNANDRSLKAQKKKLNISKSSSLLLGKPSNCSLSSSASSSNIGQGNNVPSLKVTPFNDDKAIHNISGNACRLQASLSTSSLSSTGSFMSSSTSSGSISNHLVSSPSYPNSSSSKISANAPSFIPSKYLSLGPSNSNRLKLPDISAGKFFKDDNQPTSPNLELFSFGSDVNDFLLEPEQGSTVNLRRASDTIFTFNRKFMNSNSFNNQQNFMKDQYPNGQHLNPGSNQIQQQQQPGQQNQFNSQNNQYNKKITKSSSTLFKENDNFLNNSNPNNNSYNNNQHQNTNSYFTHSISYDNIGTSSSASNGQSAASYRSSSTSTYPNRNEHRNLNNNNNNRWNKQGNQFNNNSNNQSNNNNNNGGYNNNKDQIILHVKNLDYKISSDEWKRILMENFRKHCKDIISVNVVTNPDKSLLGIVKLGTKEDARLAISCLHHKKIGYKRLNVNIASVSSSGSDLTASSTPSVSNGSNASAAQNLMAYSPKSKIVALLKSSEPSEMSLSRFIELYEQRYNQTITLSELYKLKDIIHISSNKDGHGRHIKLINKSYTSANTPNISASNLVNIDNEMEDLLNNHTPYCNLHTRNYNRNKFNQNSKGGNNSGPSGWLPNVVVSLRTFKSAVHKLLNDHGGQMPLLSFLDCYKCCIYSGGSNEHSSSSKQFKHIANDDKDQQKNSESLENALLSYKLIIDNENGVPLEHLITCAQDVQILYNESYYKQLQWENDKTKLHGGTVNNNSLANNNNSHLNENDNNDSASTGADESQQKLNLFIHEVVELFKGIPRAVIPLSKFNSEFQKKYGKQCRVADYGFTKLNELLESIPHTLQMLDGEYEKKLTLTHRVQVRRFSNDLLKVMKSHTTLVRQMFADEYPAAYEKHFQKQFNIRDYGVCYLEDMLAELPDTIISRKEINGRTFIQIPKIMQLEEELTCMKRLTYDIIEMLKNKPRFSLQFNKFIPNFHHHYGRQCKLSNYGFSRLIELLEAMPDYVQVLVKDGLQFVQLTKTFMIDSICQNLMKLIEESNLNRTNLSLTKLEEAYYNKYEPIHYSDLDCETFAQLFFILPLEKYFFLKRKVVLESNDMVDYYEYFYNQNKSKLKIQDDEYFKWANSNYKTINFEESYDINIWFDLELINERDLKRAAKLMLKKLIESNQTGDNNLNSDDFAYVIKSLSNQSGPVSFMDIWNVLFIDNPDVSALYKASSYNKRSIHFVFKCLVDYLNITMNDDYLELAIPFNRFDLNVKCITGLNDLYLFAKQIRNLYKLSNSWDLSVTELETLYKQTYKYGIGKEGNGPSTSSASKNQGFPYKILGFVDANLLICQGLSLVISIKKYSEKRLCLNRELWPKAFLETNPAGGANVAQSPSAINMQTLCDSFN